MTALDCIVIGYNEPDFEEYEQTLRRYGEHSETYRDLRFSFLELANKKMTYIDLLNYALKQAREEQGKTPLLPEQEFKSCDIPNLAAIYLVNYLRKHDMHACYINLFQFEKEQLIQYLAQDPLCIAITTTFYLWNLPINEMVDFIRHYNTTVRIVVGGPLVANYARRYEGEELTTALDDIGADIYVIESQGEATLHRLIETLKRKEPLASVPNIFYLEDGVPHRTEVSVENNSLDDNAINWNLFQHETLGATVQTRTARSCAFHCSFCAYPLRAGKLTLTNLDTIEQEIDALRDRGTIKNLVFIDDTFNVPIGRFKDICRLFIRKKYQLNWFSYFRCSNADEEAIQLMAESGCRGVFLGIESGSPMILKNMNKAVTIEKYEHGIKHLKANNILTFGSFILGFPGETIETIAETRAFIERTQPDYYRALLWYCEPGTQIYNEREKYGIVGEAFQWQHATMNSMQAMDHLEQFFLSVEGSQWLPQWSFDFWIIPYLLGRDISLAQFRGFMRQANNLLKLHIANTPKEQKGALQQHYLSDLVALVKQWPL